MSPIIIHRQYLIGSVSSYSPGTSFLNFSISPPFSRGSKRGQFALGPIQDTYKANVMLKHLAPEPQVPLGFDSFDSSATNICITLYKLT